MRSRLIVAAMLLTLPFGTRSLEAQPKLPERYTAVAIGTGGPDTSAVATPIEIVIERWSTEEERKRLLDALKKGQKTAVETITRLKSAGYLRTPESVRWDFTYIEQQDNKDGGRRIFMAVDRDLSFAEVVNNTVSSRFPFAFVELQLNKDGTGRGKLQRAGSANADATGRVIVMENYEPQAIDITQIKPRK